jgi:1-acyl-sn-glycerol-3-phosphate acyltransferase
MSVRIVRALIHLFFRLFVRLHVKNIENLPASGAYIAAANHLGRLDVPIIYHLLDRDDVTLMVAEKYRSQAIYRWLVRRMNAIFVDRFKADFNALRFMLAHMKKGGVLVIAPEGTRSPTGALIEGRPGSSYLAAKSGAPIVPVGVTGTEDQRVMDSFSRLKRPEVVVQVGKPFVLFALDGRARDEALEAHTDEIMCQIAALLPPNYRGVYSDHPRLAELLTH